MMWMRNCRSLAALGMTSISALGCGQTAGAKTAPPTTNQFIVGIDLSASRSVEALRDSRRLLDNLVESRLHNGDELVLLEMYGSSDTGDHQWIDSVPRARAPGVVTPTDRRKLDDFKAVAHQVVGAMFDPKRVRTIDNTDVFGTISRASDYAKAAHDRRSTLILLSDMENSTAEMRMERSGGVPSPEWIAIRRSANRPPRNAWSVCGSCGSRVEDAAGSSDSRLLGSLLRRVRHNALDEQLSSVCPGRGGGSLLRLGRTTAREPDDPPESRPSSTTDCTTTSCRAACASSSSASTRCRGIRLRTEVATPARRAS
jgi:hypothetical protein